MAPLTLLRPEDLGERPEAKNVACDVVTRTDSREHITPVLRDLHWLPVSRYNRLVLSAPLPCED